MLQNKRFLSMSGRSIGSLGLLSALALSLAMVASASAGAVGGRKSGNVAIERGQTRTFHVDFYSGYSAISVNSADITIRVYDGNNRLVTQSSGNQRAVNWNTPSRGQYRVEFIYQPSGNGERTRFTWNSN